MQLKDVTPIIASILEERDKHMQSKDNRYDQAVCAGLRMALRCIEQAPVVASYKHNLLTFEEAVEDDYYLERKGDEYVDVALNIYAAFHDEPHPGDAMLVKTHDDNHVKLLRIEYNKTWRCWRFRPTQEERNSILWED